MLLIIYYHRRRYYFIIEFKYRQFLTYNFHEESKTKQKETKNIKMDIKLIKTKQRKKKGK